MNTLDLKSTNITKEWLDEFYEKYKNQNLFYIFRILGIDVVDFMSHDFSLYTVHYHIPLWYTVFKYRQINYTEINDLILKIIEYKFCNKKIKLRILCSTIQKTWSDMDYDVAVHKMSNEISTKIKFKNEHEEEFYRFLIGTGDHKLNHA